MTECTVLAWHSFGLGLSQVDEPSRLAAAVVSAAPPMSSAFVCLALSSQVDKATNDVSSADAALQAVLQVGVGRYAQHRCAWLVKLGLCSLCRCLPALPAPNAAAAAYFPALHVRCLTLLSTRSSRSVSGRQRRLASRQRQRWSASSHA